MDLHHEATTTALVVNATCTLLARMMASKPEKATGVHNFENFNRAGIIQCGSTSTFCASGCGIMESGSVRPKTRDQDSCRLLVSMSNHAFIDDGRFHSGGATTSVFSETCATGFVEQKASKQALAAGKHVAYGCKVPKRIFKDQRDCNTKGQARGVAILSQCPLRQCHQQWDQPIWQTSRVVGRFALTQTGPIRVVGIYGYHQGFEDSLLKNEDLLREILHKVSCIDVPTILVGDFNCDVQSLAVWHDMDRMGWIDAALLQQQWDGEQPEMTFKETSRLDYIIFNAKAVSAFQGFAVSPQPETDHKSVTAYFDWSMVPAMRMHLSMPRSLEKLQLPRPAILHATVSQTQLLALDDAIQRQDTDAAWRLFCTTYENVLDQAYHEHHGTGLPNSCKGRGKISFVNRPQSFVLTKQGREGEFNPTGDESSILLRQRIRQIRRLETYTAQRSRLQQATSQNLPTEKLQMACAATWRAILRSTGFTPTFATWWLGEVRDDFPFDMPNLATSQLMLQALKQREPHWRGTHKAHRDATISGVFTQDWKQGGSKF